MGCTRTTASRFNVKAKSIQHSTHIYCRLAVNENPTGGFPLRSFKIAKDRTPGVKAERSTTLEPEILATNSAAICCSRVFASFCVANDPLGVKLRTGGWVNPPGSVRIMSMSRSISVCMMTHAGPGSLEARVGLCSRTRRIVLVWLGLLLRGDVMRSKPTTCPSRINSINASQPDLGRRVC